MTDYKTIQLPPDSPERPSVFTPGTPAGRKLSAFLEVFNGADPDAITSFMAEHYESQGLPGQSPEDRTRWALSLRRDTGGLKLAFMGPPFEFEMSAFVQAELTGEWFLIKLGVAPEPPHPITSITTRISQRPADAGQHPTLTDDDLISRLSELLDRLVAEDMFSGALLLARGSRPIFEYVSGLASESYGVPNQLDTKFNIGSMCKSFTAVAIGQLADRGLLSFDDPLSKHLPDYPAEIAEKVTLHHLLTHTSGMGHYWNARFEATRAKLRKVAEYIPLFIDDPLAFEPGAQYSYSNAGYILLGAVIEAASREDYFDYMREHVYLPAGMANTDAYELDRSIPNLATGYTHNGLDDRPEFGPRRNNLFMHVVKGGPAGGAFSTVHDLYSFSQALLSNKLLSPETTETLLESKVRIGAGVEKQYGYGFMLTYVNGRRVVGHSGTFPGIGARLDMFLDHGYTAAILSNYDPYITQAIGNRLREWIAGF